MKLQKLYSHVRKCINEYNMIEAGDHICLGISGGKDSLTLIYALAGIKKFFDVPFELSAITVDLGFEGVDWSSVAALCEKLEVPYTVVKTQINEIVFDAHKDERPCSLCANLRKGALNEEAKKLGCNKVAYAHHKDDMIETMMLSLLYEGRFHCFLPVTYLDKSGLTLIRPMLFVEEGEVISFARDNELPIVTNPCPVDGATRRQYVKEVCERLYADDRRFKDRMFTAVRGLDWQKEGNT